MGSSENSGVLEDLPSFFALSRRVFCPAFDTQTCTDSADVAF
jgi:hypothetical protein